MAISGITSTLAAYRTQTAPAATLNAATQPSSTPQQTGRTHHHHGGKGGNLLTASTSQSATTATNGSLLDTLI